MMSAFFAAALLSGLADASAAIQPVGTWNLHGEENSCTLEHAFSSDGQTSSFGFLPHPGRQVELLLTQASPPSKNQTKVRVTLQPSGTAFDGQIRTVALPTGGSLQSINVDNELLNALPGTTELTIAAKQGSAISIPLPGMAKAAAALTMCEEQLLKSWGVDPARFRPLAMPGKPGAVYLETAPSSADYPSAAIRAGGLTVALFAVGANGRVGDCRIIESSGNAALDRRTCQVALARTRYPPMKDSLGNPVASWTTFAFRWTPPPE